MMKKAETAQKSEKKRFSPLDKIRETIYNIKQEKKALSKDLPWKNKADMIHRRKQMLRDDSTEKRVGRTSENDRYLSAIFTLQKRNDALVVCNKKSRFSDTELRLLGEIILAEREGKRLISTQLADRLGITRSAVSQIVNRMEKDGVVKRIPDAVDRKIAYVIMTEETLQEYQAELKSVKGFIGKIVREYGVEKFNALCQMMDEFLTLIEKKKA